jgi:hypothetical protein
MLMGENYDLVVRSNFDILANGGDIDLTLADAITNDWYISSTVYIGSKASSLVTSSSSDFTLTADSLNWYGVASPYIGLTGDIIWQSVSSSFGHYVESSWFNWNQNSQTMGSLTIGKSTNSSNVTVNNTINANGSVVIYGGDITAQSSISTTSATVMFY